MTKLLISPAFRFVYGLLAAAMIAQVALSAVMATPLWRVLPVVPPIFGEPDLATGYKLSSNMSGVWVKENRARIQTSSIGLRDTEMTRERPPGTTRVALTGDSYVEAFQVPQEFTFETAAERNLRAQGYSVEIANLGMSGHGPLRQFARLREIKKVLDLDMVVSMFRTADLLTNEMFDDNANPAYVPDGQGGLKEGDRFRQRVMIRYRNNPFVTSGLWLVQHVDVVRIVFWLYSNARAGTNVSRPAPRHAVVRIGGCSAEAELQVQRKLWLEHLPERNWQGVEKFLDDYADWIHKNNLAATIGVFLRNDADGMSHCKDAKKMRAETISRIRDEVVRRRLVFFDFEAAITDILRQRGIHSSIFGFPPRTAGHLNFEGHEVYATVLTRLLLSRLSGSDRAAVGTR